jgi:hypothetical protein
MEPPEDCGRDEHADLDDFESASLRQFCDFPLRMNVSPQNVFI